MVSAPDRVPFSRAMAVDPLGGGRFRAELHEAWAADGGKQHGGVLLALTTSAALAALEDRESRPLAVSAVFPKAGSTGPATAIAEIVPGDGPVRVVRSVLQQDGEALLEATVTAGRLPADPARPNTEPLPLTPEPTPEAHAQTGSRTTGPPLASACEVRIDPATTAYRRRERAAPVIRGWVRPDAEPPDVLFALFAGDILPTGLFNFGLLGWAPTVQLTALVRAVPAPGWLRVGTAVRTIAGGWFDEDVTVVDSTGQLVCRARQLARSPRPRG
jgi:hypothetical protein